MKSVIPDRILGAKWAWRLAVLLLIAATSSRTFAALGGTVASVRDDAARASARVKVTEANGYTVHELTTPTSTVVREYVSPAGRVFGIAWQGPFIPDMRQFLGIYFDQYSQAAKVQRESRVGRQPLNIREPGLLVQTSGHMRAYSGRCLDPGLLPPGVGTNDVR